MEFAAIGITVSAVLGTFVASWFSGSKSELRNALTQADDVIGMLAVKISLLERENLELKERLSE